MDFCHAIVKDHKDGVVLSVYVQPKAPCTECAGIHGDALKIRVVALPFDGVANDELIRFIADRCMIPRTNILFQAGGKGQRKRLRLRGVTAQSVISGLVSVDQKGAVKICTGGD